MFLGGGRREKKFLREMALSFWPFALSAGEMMVHFSELGWWESWMWVGPRPRNVTGVRFVCEVARAPQRVLQLITRYADRLIAFVSACTFC